jgi:hypothetical protein
MLFIGGARNVEMSAFPNWKPNCVNNCRQVVQSEKAEEIPTDAGTEQQRRIGPE